MVIYEVNLAIRPDTVDAFHSWLTKHIDEILEIDGFVKANWYKRKHEDEGVEPKDETLWTVQYYLNDRDALESYFTHHAQRMRQEGLELFGGKFTASRRILEPVHS